jgi:predicted HD phosphohydrolase
VENAHIRENEQGAFEIKDNPACQELLYSRYGGASSRDVKNFFAFVQEGVNKGYFSEQLSLAFFHAPLINIFVIRKKDSGINGETKQVLAC